VVDEDHLTTSFEQEQADIRIEDTGVASKESDLGSEEDGTIANSVLGKARMEIEKARAASMESDMRKVEEQLRPALLQEISRMDQEQIIANGRDDPFSGASNPSTATSQFGQSEMDVDTNTDNATTPENDYFGQHGDPSLHDDAGPSRTASTTLAQSEGTIGNGAAQEAFLDDLQDPEWANVNFPGWENDWV
jgi:hypothetical protein